MSRRALRFRRIALDITGAVEAAHMGHADFRGHGRILAIHPDGRLGMVHVSELLNRQLTH